MNLTLKYRKMKSVTEIKYFPNIDNFSDLWTLIRSAIETDFDYIEIVVNK